MGSIAKNFALMMDSWRVLPLVAMSLLPALTIRFKNLLVSTEYAYLAENFYVTDITSWWKSVFVLGIALWMCAHLLFRLLTGWRPKFDFFTAVCLLAVIATVISMFASKYPVTARWGVVNQYEGGMVILSYLLSLWYAGVMLDGERERYLLLRLIGFVALINAVIGIGQGLGFDFWQSTIGVKLLGSHGFPLRFSFSETRLAYGTLFQPNHYGLFMAMAAVLAANAFSVEKKRVFRFYWALIFALSLLGVVFSQSRASLAVVVICFVMRLFISVSKNIGATRRSVYNRVREALLYHWQVILLAVGVISVAVLTTFFLLGKEQVYRITLSQLERTVKDLDRVVIDSDLQGVELVHNRIVMKLEKGEVALKSDAQGNWSAEGDVDGQPPRLLEIPVTTGRRFELVGQPGFSLVERSDGRIAFICDDVRLRFFRDKEQVFVVDGQDGMHAEMRTADSLPTGGLDRLLSRRIYIWSRALPLVADAPFWGSGPGTFGLVFPNLDMVGSQRFFFRDIFENMPHGVWAALLVQLGVCGFLAFCLLFAYSLFTAVDSGAALTKPLAYAMVAWAFGSLTNDSTVGVTPIACIVCGISVSAYSERHRGEGWSDFIHSIFGPGKYYPLVKRCIDMALVVVTLPLTIPLILGIILVIRLDSPGKALFSQWRCGKGRERFLMYKFRTMQAAAPTDMPTFLLSNPSAHITRVGRMLRRFSLDELPQLYNVLKGELSLIGPRPVLLRETRLINEREKYGANDILPGITGWAQINGRDHLPAPLKAWYDGEYVKNMNLWLDVKILLLTIPIALWGKGVREGRSLSKKGGR